MGDPWLDPMFQPLRQTAFSQLSTDYSNSTTSYTSVLSYPITIGRFATTAGATTKLHARASGTWTSVTGACRALFALVINGTTYSLGSDTSALDFYTPFSLETVVSLAAGTYTVSVQAKLDAGGDTVQILAATRPTLARCTLFLAEYSV